MNFDVKDVKSWANRHDVKIKAVTGFFGNSLSEIDNEIRRYNKGEKDHLHELYKISDNGCYCFGYALYFADTGAFGGTQTFAFFLPLDAVKEDKPKEKKYRPLKKIKDFYDCGVIKGKDDCLIDRVLRLRDKKNYNLTRDMKVIDVEYDFDTVIRINRCSPVYYFSCFDIYINDEWVPFGVEVEDEY